MTAPPSDRGAPPGPLREGIDGGEHLVAAPERSESVLGLGFDDAGLDQSTQGRIDIGLLDAKFLGRRSTVEHRAACQNVQQFPRIGVAPDMETPIPTFTDASMSSTKCRALWTALSEAFAN